MADFEPQTIVSLAADALAAEDCAKAIDLCTQAIEIDSGLLMAYWYLGLAQLLQGYELEAQATWISAITAIDLQEADQAINQLLCILF